MLELVALRTQVTQTAPGTAIDQDFDFREFEGFGFIPRYAIFEILNLSALAPAAATFFVTAILSQTDQPGVPALGLSSSKYSFGVWKMFGNGVQAAGAGAREITIHGGPVCRRGNMSIKLDSANSGGLVSLGCTVYGEVIELTELQLAYLSFIPV